MITALVVFGVLVLVGASFLGGYVGERHDAVMRVLNEAQLAEMSRINVTLNHALDAARRSEVALGECNHALTEKLVQADARIRTLEARLRNDDAEGGKLDEVDALLGRFVNS